MTRLSLSLSCCLGYGASVSGEFTHVLKAFLEQLAANVGLGNLTHDVMLKHLLLCVVQEQWFLKMSI